MLNLEIQVVYKTAIFVALGFRTNSNLLNGLGQTFVVYFFLKIYLCFVSTL